jgi:Ca2+-binding EF-hand superfamily protein
MFEEVFSRKKLLRKEVEDSFRIADKDNSGLIDKDEWTAFYDIFIEDFKSCDTNEDWEIDSREGVQCFVNQAWWKQLMIFGDDSLDMDAYPAHEGEKSKMSSMLDLFYACDRNHSGGINFAEYLFMRSITSAWRRCVTGQRMNYKELQCGIRITTPNKGSVLNLGEARRLFLHALSWMDMTSKRISLPIFAALASYYTMFQS